MRKIKAGGRTRRKAALEREKRRRKQRVQAAVEAGDLGINDLAAVEAGDLGIMFFLKSSLFTLVLLLRLPHFFC